MSTAGAATLRMGSCGGRGVIQLYPPPTVNIMKLTVREDETKNSLNLEIVNFNTGFRLRSLVHGNFLCTLIFQIFKDSAYGIGGGKDTLLFVTVDSLQFEHL